jgi:DNA/RNA endonuclease YhcR with UshA esterase domain
MKTHITLITALCLLSIPALAQDAKSASPKKIAAADAINHYQENVIVTGKVAQVTIREKLVYVNLDKKYPDTPLTCVVFAKATNQFGNLKQLEGKPVEINGKVEEYRDQPQIVLNSTDRVHFFVPVHELVLRQG